MWNNYSKDRQSTSGKTHFKTTYYIFLYCFKNVLSSSSGIWGSVHVLTDRHITCLFLVCMVILTYTVSTVSVQHTALMSLIRRTIPYMPKPLEHVLWGTKPEGYVKSASLIIFGFFFKSPCSSTFVWQWTFIKSKETRKKKLWDHQSLL